MVRSFTRIALVRQIILVSQRQLCPPLQLNCPEIKIQMSHLLLLGCQIWCQWCEGGHMMEKHMNTFLFFFCSVFDTNHVNRDKQE